MWSISIVILNFILCGFYFCFYDWCLDVVCNLDFRCLFIYSIMWEFGNGLIGFVKFDVIELGYKVVVNFFVGFYVDCVFKFFKLCNFYVLLFFLDWIGMI